MPEYGTDATATPEQRERDFVAGWKKELAQAEEREKDWLKEAAKVTELYEKGTTARGFNILYANSETVRPHLYSQTPTPRVAPRFAKSPVAKIAALTLERALTFLIDPNNPEQASFDEGMKFATLSALVPGRGVLWLRYLASFAPDQIDTEVMDGDAPAGEVVTYETVELEALPYNRFLHGYGATWTAVPWVARIDFMTRQELASQFGEEVAARVRLDMTYSASSESDASEGREAQKPKDAGDVEMTKVYQIWYKATGEVITLASGADFPLNRVPDPLGLEGMFPCAAPLTYVPKLTSLKPCTLYSKYKPQAEELNDVCQRISSITRALKVRGFYDRNVGDLESLLRSDDLTLLPAENAAALMGQGGGLDRSIWLMPLEKLAGVLQQLYIQRDAVKQIIYEMMGISDILRGGGRASESATQTEMKSKYGSFRLQDMQSQTEMFVVSTLRLMAQLVATKFSTTTLERITEIVLPTQEQKAQAQMAAQAGDPSAQKLAQFPTWDEVKAFLGDSIQRTMSLDVETGSTAAVDKAAEMSDFTELLNGFAQFGNAIGPLLESGLLTPDAARVILKAFVSKTTLGRAVEDALDNPQQPQGQGQGKPDPKAEAAAQEAQVKVQSAQMKLQLEQQLAQMKLQLEEMKLQMEQAKLQMDQEKAQMKLQAERTKAAQALLMPQEPAEVETGEE